MKMTGSKSLKILEKFGEERPTQSKGMRLPHRRNMINSCFSVMPHHRHQLERSKVAHQFFPIFLLVAMWLTLIPAQGGSKNLLPRMPEFVIEKGYSDSFQVVECSGEVNIVNNEAESRLKAKLKNVSDQALKTSIKIRILYLFSDHSATVKVDGERVKFSRENPRIPLEINPGQEVDLEVSARHNIQYNLDAIRKEEEENGTKKKSRLDLGDLSRYFEQENFGRRFLIGPLVSKWGIFPVDFQSIHIKVSVPSDFIGIFPVENNWKKSKKSNSSEYSFEGSTGYNGALFLPEKDLPKFVPILDQVGSTTSF